MSAANAAWDGIIAQLEKDIANRKSGVLEARDSLEELSKVYDRRSGELRTYVDHEVDQVAALTSMLEHARRERDGDPLVAAIEAPAAVETVPEVSDGPPAGPAPTV